MTTDIATLGIKVDSSQTVDAATSLDKLAESGAKVENATKKVSTAGEALAEAHKTAATESEGLASTLKGTVTEGLAAVYDRVTNLTASFNLNRNQSLELTHSLRSFVDMLSAGMGPMRALEVEGPRLAQVFGEGNGGIAGAFSAVTKFITPMTVGLGLAAVATLAAVKSLANYENALSDFDTLAKGMARTSGLTASAFEQIAESAASASNSSLASTRAYVAAFAEAGVKSQATLAGLAGVTDDYAKLTGETVPDALKQLTTAFADPAKGADDLNSKLGFLTASQLDQINAMELMGNKEGAASVLMKALNTTVDESSNKTVTFSKIIRDIGGDVSVVTNLFGRLDTSIRSAAASYDAWVQAHLGNIGTDLIGTGNLGFNKAGDPNAQRNIDISAGRKLSASLDTSGLTAYNALLANRAVLEKAVAASANDNSAATQQLRHDLAATNDTIAANTNANGHLITTQERQHELSVAQAALGAAHTNAQKAAATAALTRLQTGSQLLTNGEREQQVTDASTKALTHYTAAHDDGAKAVARHIAEMQAAVTSQNTLNAAILLGAGTELQANAAKDAAVAMAGKKYSAQQAELEQTLQLQLAISKYVGTVNTAANAEYDRSSIIRDGNMLIASGMGNVADAERLMATNTVIAPMLQVLEVLPKGSAAYIQLADAIDKVTKNLEAGNKATASSTLLAAIEKANSASSLSAKSLARVGETPLNQAIGNATDQANATIAGMGKDAGKNDEQNAYIAGQISSAVAAQKLSTAQEAYNSNLKNTATALGDINDSAHGLGSLLSDAFGKAGDGISNFLTGLTSARAEQQGYYDELLAAQQKYSDGGIESSKALAAAQSHYASQTKNAQLNSYGSAISGIKSMFSEHSKAYRAMEAIEKVYAAVRLAIQIKDILFTGIVTGAKVAGAAASSAADVAQTGVAVANSGIRSTAYGIEAFAHTIASLPFPLNIAAGAAVAAILIAAGVKMFGGGGGGSASASSTASDALTPYDYSSQNSSYSVNDPDASYGGAANNNGGGYGTGNSTSQGSTHIWSPTYNINANGLTAGDVDDLKSYIDQKDDQTFTNARQASAQDAANRNNRQMLAGNG